MDVVTLIGIFVPTAALILNMFMASRSSKKDTIAQAESAARLKTDVSYIKEAVGDIKNGIKSMQTRVDDLDKRVTIVERDTARAHTRIDELKHKGGIQ